MILTIVIALAAVVGGILVYRNNQKKADAVIAKVEPVVNKVEAEVKSLAEKV